MNRHDRYFAAQRINPTPRELRKVSPLAGSHIGEMACYAPPDRYAVRRRPRRSRVPAFVAGVAVGLALGLAWGATAATPYERHVDAYERHTTYIGDIPCLDRAHLAMSVARAKLAGLPLPDAMSSVRDAARESGLAEEDVAAMLALVLRVWAQSDEPEAAFDREFATCAREEVAS